jgi:hypothetical protein
MEKKHRLHAAQRPKYQLQCRPVRVARLAHLVGQSRPLPSLRELGRGKNTRRVPPILPMRSAHLWPVSSRPVGVIPGHDYLAEIWRARQVSLAFWFYSIYH